MHSIGDRSTRVGLDALAAARASNGDRGIPHTLAHLQVVHPDDQRRLGELGLYLTFTYAWTTPQLAYDMLVTPFIQPTRAGQSLSEALYDPLGYLQQALYPVESSRKAGAILVAGSDAPVDSRDPRPFENMAAGIVRATGSDDAFRASQRISLTEMLAAYTINGARAVRQGRSPAPSRRANPPISSCSTGICSPWSRPARRSRLPTPGSNRPCFRATPSTRPLSQAADNKRPSRGLSYGLTGAPVSPCAGCSARLNSAATMSDWVRIPTSCSPSTTGMWCRPPSEKAPTRS